MAKKQRRQNPLAKLRSYRTQVVRDMIKALKQAQQEIKGQIALAAGKASIAKSAREREALFKEIEGRYRELAEGIDKQLAELTGKIGKASHQAAVLEMAKAKHKAKILRYDPERTARYFQMIHPTNAKNIAAVFTDQMSGRLITSLRSAYIDVFRQGVVEGMTANEMQKALRDRWDKLAGDGNQFRFVDRAGRRWENARYLQMLTNTNAQRVAIESHIDTFAQEGLTLMRISDDGDADCEVCAAWEGRIVQTVGDSDKWPTYDDALAAGVFHPNCTHTLEYVDELIHKKEIERQEELSKPDEYDVETMQAQKDEIDEGRYLDKGMSQKEAARAVTTDRIEKAIRAGIFSDAAARAAYDLTPAELDWWRKNGVPMFEKARKGEKVGSKKHGRILTQKDATAADVLKLMREWKQKMGEK